MLVALLISMLLAPVPMTQTTAQEPVTKPDETPWPPIGVFKDGPDVTRPKILREVKANYTADAMRAGIAGKIELEIVVKIDGTVGDVRVTKSLDREYGLDREAVRCVKKWLFVPGKKDGEVVPVLVGVEMAFSPR
jgi:protein TonB